ncbi:hypothetical protein YC2023_048816 [Brassica napus]
MPMMFLGKLHVLTHLIHSKAYIRSCDGKINQFANKFSIEFRIMKWLAVFNLPLSWYFVSILHWHPCCLASISTCTFQKIKCILSLGHE